MAPWGVLNITLHRDAKRFQDWGFDFLKYDCISPLSFLHTIEQGSLRDTIIVMVRICDDPMHHMFNTMTSPVPIDSVVREGITGSASGFFLFITHHSSGKHHFRV